MSKVDEVQPDGKWEFDESVAEVFGDMLARSIPQIEVMRQTVTDLALEALPRHEMAHGHAVDLGASRGDALAPLVEARQGFCKFHAVETAASMLKTLIDRWPQGAEATHGVEIWEADIARKYPDLPQAEVTLCVLTLQFTPIEHRQRILRDIWKRTKPGGRLILVEKILGDTAVLDESFKRHYHEMKGRNGYTQEQIERKALSLEGVLVPVTARMNEEILAGAGFSQIGRFWQWLNFAGWVAIR